MSHRPQICPQHIDHHAGCPNCRAHSTWYHNTRRQLIVNGEWTGMVDADGPRRHATALVDAGMCRAHIASQAGVSKATIADLLDADRPTMYPDTAAAVLGVRLELHPRSQVPAVGASRRIHAMIWQGYSRAWISAQAQVAFGSVRLLANGRLDRIEYATHRRISDLFRRYVDRLAPDTRDSRAAHREAVAKGWHGPGAWDDIDNPADEPQVDAETDDVVDAVLVAQVAAGARAFTDLTDEEKLLLFRDHFRGDSRSQIMRVLKASASTVYRWQYLAGTIEQVAA